MQQEFEKDQFSLENLKVHKCFNDQREELRAFQPELSEYFICEKILKQYLRACCQEQIQR